MLSGAAGDERRRRAMAAVDRRRPRRSALRRRRCGRDVSAPKVYGFDTGFVCYHREWHDLRGDDLGLLWEHFVLSELHAHVGRGPIRYWRRKHGNAVDFVLAARGRSPAAIECTWSASDFDAANLRAFRHRYPRGQNFVVARDVDGAFSRRHGDLAVRFVGLDGLVGAVAAP